MEQKNHLSISLILSTIIIFCGTVGYMVIEGWNLLDALYMTIITISTVGYQEVHPVSQTGRMFTVGLVFFGVGFTLYVAGAVVQFMVEGRIRSILGRRRLEKQIKKLQGQYIICGYGRIGRVLCRKLGNKSLKLVVIERDDEMIPKLDADGVLYVSGEATDENILKQAGIERAKGLVAALATDTDNVFLTLTARQLNPDLHILARASNNAVKSKLIAAGANQVESPYEMGAVSMAHRIIRPTVTNFLDLAFADSRTDIQMEEIPVNEKSELVNVQLKDSGIRQRFNLIIIAIKKPNGDMLFNPSFEATINGGDTLIAVGEGQNLEKLEAILRP
jgi:voltage-gated potassium channel